MTPHLAQGVHLLAELDGCAISPTVAALAGLLRNAAEAAGASVVAVHTHDYGKNGGVAGVALLSESHISVHTWPEAMYAAVDVFMCGDGVDPGKALDVLVAGLAASRVRRRDILRQAHSDY